MSKSDPNRLAVKRDFSVPGVAFCVDRVPESGQLYFGSSDFKVYEVDALAEKPESKAFEAEGHNSYVMGVALAGLSLVSGSYDGRLIWWDREKREPVKSVDAHGRWIRRVMSSPDGSLVASVADDMLGKVWNVETGEVVHTLKDHKEETPHNYPSMLYAVAFSPDGKLLATGDKVGHVAVWNVESGEKVGEVESPGMYTWDPRQRRHSIGGIRSLAFSQDSRLLAVGGIGKIGNIDHLGGPSRVEIFDWQKKESIHTIEDDKMKGLVEQMVFDPAGKWLLGSGGDHGGFVNLYNLDDGKLLKQVKAPMHVHEFVMNEDANTIYAAGHGKIAVVEFMTEEAEKAREEAAKKAAEEKAKAEADAKAAEEKAKADAKAAEEKAKEEAKKDS